ncbi:hypothetical protein BRAS3843_680044 [Bradyrhizobium sp. STM 3843]|nr:hypothetical protein BRAS3843_680044 [Bradyrhizobium sp. STM 3843]
MRCRIYLIRLPVSCRPQPYQLEINRVLFADTSGATIKIPLNSVQVMHRIGIRHTVDFAVECGFPARNDL